MSLNLNCVESLSESAWKISSCCFLHLSLCVFLILYYFLYVSTCKQNSFFKTLIHKPIHTYISTYWCIAYITTTHRECDKVYCLLSFSSRTLFWWRKTRIEFHVDTMAGPTVKTTAKGAVENVITFTAIKSNALARDAGRGRRLLLLTV